MDSFDRLVGIVAQLRAPEGCPWDRAQTPETMRPYLVEEVHEVLDAIDVKNDLELRKELGDLLFMVVLLCQMKSEETLFTIEDVVEDVADKMVVRHPHVFDPDHDKMGNEGTISEWERRKAKERPAQVSALDGVPRAMPALLRAHRITEKASRVGFDWPDYPGVRAKLDEEIGELDEAHDCGDEHAVGHEFGDLLFTLVNMGRFLPLTSEDALRLATNRFERRFRHVESTLAHTGRSIHEVDLDELQAHWQRAKRTEVTPS